MSMVMVNIDIQLSYKCKNVITVINDFNKLSWTTLQCDICF